MGVRLRETVGRSANFPALATEPGVCRKVAARRRTLMLATDEIPANAAGCVLPCSDEQGGDRELTLVFAGRRMVLTTPDGIDVVLTPLQVERLRAALRDLLLDVDPGDYV